ncbi:MAG: alpha/beta fold hydrolase [Saprospiraceae bacterium]
MKPNLLLLHGALGSEVQFATIKDLLVSKYEVFSFNFSGHGGEKIPNTGLRMNDFSHEIIKCLDKNKIESTHIFGYSMGGYAALKCVLNNSSRINKIITLGTKFDWSPLRLEQQLQMLNTSYLEEKSPAFVQDLIRMHAPTDWIKLIDEIKSMMCNLSQTDYILDEAFQAIHNPVFILLGELDKMVTKEESYRVANLIPNSKFNLLEQTKHPFDKIDLELLSNQILSIIKN